MTIEEKAKRYDEAIEIARLVLQERGNEPDGASILSELFPELAESEDERIRKTLIAVVNLYYGEGEDEEKTACLYWLEKQGEYKKFRDSIQVGDKVTRNEEGVLINLSQLNRVAKKDEKQGEQNLVKIPKFKSGDTIEFNGLGHNRYIIKEVCGTTHYINSNGEGMDMSYTDANFELVEQKPVLDIDIPFGAKDSDLKEVTYDIPKGYHAEIEDNKVVIKKGEQKPVEWSKEDEKKLEQCCVAITDSYFNKIAKGQILIDWLKSLKERFTWKPSDEQMQALEYFIINHNEHTGYAKDLEELRQNLKKLKE